MDSSCNEKLRYFLGKVSLNAVLNPKETKEMLKKEAEKADLPYTKKEVEENKKMIDFLVHDKEREESLGARILCRKRIVQEEYISNIASQSKTKPDTVASWQANFEMIEDILQCPQCKRATKSSNRMHLVCKLKHRLCGACLKNHTKCPTCSREMEVEELDHLSLILSERDAFIEILDLAKSI